MIKTFFVQSQVLIRMKDGLIGPHLLAVGAILQQQGYATDKFCPYPQAGWPVTLPCRDHVARSMARLPSIMAARAAGSGDGARFVAVRERRGMAHSRWLVGSG
jgi:hypothetical protein